MREWRVIERFPNYAISNDGRVRNIKYNREIKPRISGYGYKIVRVFRDGIEYLIPVHKAVLRAFVRKPKRREQGNHKNGIKTDNRLDNLEWLTPSANIRHGWETGLIKVYDHSIKDRSNYKLTWEIAKEIRESYKPRKVTRQSLTEKYNITVSAINRVLSGETWNNETN